MNNEILNSNQNWSTSGLIFPRNILLHSMLVNCGYETRQQENYDFDGLCRGQSEFAIFQYTISGEGALQYEDRSFRMKAGDAMIVHIPHAHRYYLPEDADHWRHLYLTVSGIEAIRILRETESRFGPVIHLPHTATPIRKAVAIILQSKKGVLSSPFKLSAATYDFTVSLYEYMLAGNNEAERQNQLIIKNVHKFCLSHITEEIDVSDIAKAAGYSRSHFTRIFHKLYGITPAQYLTELRLRSAIRMLQMECCSIKEIAARCGFRDESYFCKVFRKYHSLSPEKFRKGKI